MDRFDPGDATASNETFVDQLARIIHDRYIAERLRNGQTWALSSTRSAWEDLSEDLREANRDQARDIWRKLEQAECQAVPGASDAAAPFAFTASELNRLAETEHERWLTQRVGAGWSYGPERDDAAKRHPDMVPWSDLTADAQDKDREVVVSILELLHDAGFRVVRRGVTDDFVNQTVRGDAQ